MKMWICWSITDSDANSRTVSSRGSDHVRSMWNAQNSLWCIEGKTLQTGIL